MSETVK